jgi:hypothetical protein
MSRIESITGSTEVMESTPIMMKEMKIVDSIDVISDSDRMSLVLIGMKTLPSSSAINIDSINRES